MNKLRTALFLAAALLHGLLILFLAFKAEYPGEPAEPEPPVIRLVDLVEDAPPPPPPPKEPPPPLQQNTVEAIAETMVETDDVPQDTVSPLITPPPPPPPPRQIEYLSMGQISKRPDFSREDLEKLAAYLKRNYPPIALRSGIEGRVILELFIDAQGAVRRIEVLREDPEGRGFGEVAKQGFSAIRAVKPARANEAPVAVRYRYPIAFTIK